MSVKSAKRHSTSTEQKGVGRQYGEVQEVCCSKKMESKFFPLILSLIFTHTHTHTLKLQEKQNSPSDSSSRPQNTSLWQLLAKKNSSDILWCHHNCCRARHNHQIYCQCCFPGRLLVCLGSSRLTRHRFLASKIFRDCFSVVVLAELSCHVSVFRLQSGTLEAPGFAVTLILTLSLFISTSKHDEAETSI